MGTCQSAASAITSLVYILLRRKRGERLIDSLGLKSSIVSSHNGKANANGLPNGRTRTHQIFADYHDNRKALLLRYLQCAAFITSAAPFGFAALSHISYPTMVLGKSCKLVPVMLMNVVLYRRKFAPHKYLVVVMVTLGITMFMGFGGEKSKKAAPSSSSFIGILYLLINLAIDGATNSTQDEIFAQYKVTGQQMMFWINVISTVITTILSILPLPYIPVLHPSYGGHSEFAGAINFIQEHPSIVSPLIQFSLTGSLGQLFIFETLQHFGSLTLVYVSENVIRSYLILVFSQNNNINKKIVYNGAFCYCLQP